MNDGSSIRLTPRTETFGCGIYEVGDPEKCYVKLFVTHTDRVIPVTGRVITEDDLITAYTWGRLDAEEYAKEQNAQEAKGVKE